MRLGSLIAASLVLAVLVPGQAATAAQIHAGKMGIGDSVMLDGKAGLLARGFVRVDAVVSRQFSAAPGVIAYWRKRGLLPSIVVVHLGTNGKIPSGDCQATVGAVGSRQIYFVTLKLPRNYRNYNNALLAGCVHRNQNAHLIDWYAYSRTHANWFASDGFHLTATGAYYYAKFVANQS